MLAAEKNVSYAKSLLPTYKAKGQCTFSLLQHAQIHTQTHMYTWFHIQRAKSGEKIILCSFKAIKEAKRLRDCPFQAKDTFFVPMPSVL